MSGRVDWASRELGCEVIRLLTLASEFWCRGDVIGAEQVARGAWRLVGPRGQLVDVDDAGDDREAGQ
jgi:hypothetical protein